MVSHVLLLEILLEDGPSCACVAHDRRRTSGRRGCQFERWSRTVGMLSYTCGIPASHMVLAGGRHGLSGFLETPICFCPEVRRHHIEDLSAPCVLRMSMRELQDFDALWEQPAFGRTKVFDTLPQLQVPAGP